MPLRCRASLSVGPILLLLAAIRASAEVGVPSVNILTLNEHVERLGPLDAFGETLCLGADGRVGVEVSGRDGRRALACGDASGFRAVVRQDDPSPRGGVFADFVDCALGADGALYFSATRVSEPGKPPNHDVYRATATGVEWIIGPGARASNGAEVRRLIPLNGSNSFFELNERGTVLVRASATNLPVGFVRVRADGSVQILVTRSGERQAYNSASLAGDDTAVAVGGVASDEAGILALDADTVRVRFSVADIVASGALPEALQYMFYLVEARGDVVSFTVEYWTTPSWSVRTKLFHTPARGFAPVIDPTLYDDVWVSDVTPTGRLLVAGFKDENPNLNYYEYVDYVVVDGADVELIARDRDDSFVYPLYGFPDAITLNDRRNVLLQRRVSRDSGVRQSLSLTGPAPEARCFVPPTAIAPTASATPTATPTLTPPPTLTPTPPIDCAAQPDACAYLRIGSASGIPGGPPVTVVVSLDAGPWSIVGLQGDLRLLPAASVARTATSEPACRVNPSIGKPDSAFAFQPWGCSTDCTHVRAMVLAFDNLEPIPNGAVIFTCDLLVAESGVPGVYPLAIEFADASDAAGRGVPIASTAGVLHVSRASSAQGASVSSGTSAAGSGCHIGPSGDTAGTIMLLLAPLILALWRR